MAGEATHPDLINGSLAGILSELEQDKTFLKLAAGDIEASDDVDNSVLSLIHILLLGLLQLFECGADDLRVEQTNLRGGVALLGQSALLALVGYLVLLGLELVKTVGGAGAVSYTHLYQDRSR